MFAARPRGVFTASFCMVRMMLRETGAHWRGMEEDYCNKLNDDDMFGESGTERRTNLN